MNNYLIFKYSNVFVVNKVKIITKFKKKFNASCKLRSLLGLIRICGIH